MNQQDIMKKWFKELASEEPSPDFTSTVMKRVMSEWSLNPVKYQPIISKRGWWTVAIITLLLTTLLFLLHSSLPTEADSLAQTKAVYGIDLAQLFLPINQLFVKLTNISPAIAIGALAILALWFFDQLFIKTVRR